MSTSPEPPSNEARSSIADAPAATLRRALPEDPIAAMGAIRDRTLAVVDGLAVDDLERQVTPILSPLCWDLAHIAAYEDLWLVHEHGGRELLHSDLTEAYDAFETPRSVRGEIELLCAEQSRAYLGEVRERTLEVAQERGLEPTLREMVVQHEMQHVETMLQAMRLGSVAPWLEALPGGEAAEASPHAAGDPTGLTDVAGGEVVLGADDAVFAYDNERPQHRATIQDFRIGRHPLDVGTWRAFQDDGGYDHRRWWTDEGWAWRGQADPRERAAAGDGSGRVPRLGPPQGAQDASVACHLSWHEATAIAAWAGLRLPTESEWEHARRSGALAGDGAVWEWTATEFDGYDGFRPHPYPEYSQVFFRRGYRVLRGGSFATHPRVGTTTFRNWDLPERHQIFSGVRLAGDAA